MFILKMTKHCQCRNNLLCFLSLPIKSQNVQNGRIITLNMMSLPAAAVAFSFKATSGLRSVSLRETHH